MINFCNALSETMEVYGISGVWLSQRSGLSNQTISNFKLGKASLKVDSLEKIIAVLPTEAQEYFFNKLYPIDRTLRSLILKADNNQKAEVLELISKSLLSGNTEEGKLKLAV